MVAPLIIAAAITAAGSVASSALSNRNSGGTNTQLSTQTKNQKQLEKQIIEGLTKGTGPFADLYKFNEEEFKKGVIDPATKEFRERELPELNEQFIAGNQVAGSGMRRGQLKAANDFQSKIAELIYKAKTDKDTQKQNALNAILGNKSVENVYSKPSESPYSTLIQELTKGASAAAMNYQPNSPAASNPTSNFGVTGANATAAGIPGA